VEDAGPPTAAQRGREVADQSCSKYHRAAPDQPSGLRNIRLPSVAAPCFMTVAARPYADVSCLTGFVSELHLPMLTFPLSPAEKADVVGYILVLKDLGLAPHAP
jgi:hypothetical protein